MTTCCVICYVNDELCAFSLCRCHWYDDPIYKENKMDKFKELLSKINTIHNIKKADYSETENRFSNFEYSDFVARPFPNNHKSFAVLVGTKLARIAVLLTKEIKNTSPKNESLSDSFMDLATYCVIWWHFYEEKK